MQEIPSDCVEEEEDDPLSCSLALQLYKFRLHYMDWHSLSDVMIIFIFR